MAFFCTGLLDDFVFANLLLDLLLRHLDAIVQNVFDPELLGLLAVKDHL